jgi:hypothetical protein
LYKHVAPGVDLGDNVSAWLERAALADDGLDVVEDFRPLRLLYMPPDLGRTMPRHEGFISNFDSSHMVRNVLNTFLSKVPHVL